MLFYFILYLKVFCTICSYFYLYWCTHQKKINSYLIPSKCQSLGGYLTSGFQCTSWKLDINDFKQRLEGFGWAAALVRLCNVSLHPSLPVSEHSSSESGCQELEGWESSDQNRFALPQLPRALLRLQRTGNSIMPSIPSQHFIANPWKLQRSYFSGLANLYRLYTYVN